MTFVLDIADNMRKHCNVIATPGCEKRGNGSAWGVCEGHVNHHTGGGNNIYYDQNLVSGVPGLSGPLCNYAILYDGDLAIIAAYPANHAGASGGWDTAPLPRTNDFNRRVLGTEIQYKGTEPMSKEQYRTMCALNWEIVNYFRWSEGFNRCKTHNGTSVQGKWDPGYAMNKTYDIAQLRRDYAAFGQSAAPAVDEDDSPEWKAILGQFTGVLL